MENIQISTALIKHSGTLSHNHTMCYMEDTQQKTNDNWDLKSLLQMVKLMARGHDWLPLTLRKFRLTNGARPQFSQISVICPMKMLWALWLKVIQYYHVTYWSCTFTAPMFAHLQLSALPEFWFTFNLAFLMDFYWALSEPPIPFQVFIV